MATRISGAEGMVEAAAMGALILASPECKKIPVALFGGLVSLIFGTVLRFHLLENLIKTFGHFFVGCENNLVVHLKDKAAVFLVKVLVEFGRFGVELVPASDPDSVLGDFNCVFCSGKSACEGSCED
ncbi:hypothetical protein FIE12Z_3320 [Fusarium flagelliforme]|uniref:Uncharacterized protein n=1 Tax=Fusarium flagelliforme TaxID=2675880 RepID=A0A395MYU7_9HYPO|nr:hypothetical protein FIE12Z_3320 [Fusarium flagelliforme]